MQIYETRIIMQHNIHKTLFAQNKKFCIHESKYHYSSITVINKFCLIDGQR